MTTHRAIAPQAPTLDIRSPAFDTWFPVVFAVLTLILAAASFLVSVPFGIAVCASLTGFLCVTRPMDVPLFLVASFLFQNVIIALFTPLVPSEGTFNILRGMNFVMLAIAFAVFVVAAFTRQWSGYPRARSWVLAVLGVAVVIAFYTGLGMVRGDPMDAAIYFRNTITPIACFLVGFMVVLFYRFDSVPGLAVMGAVAAVYGYFELFFGLDFLSLFNGDQYIMRQTTQQIQSGYWEKVLEQTGFVFTGLSDAFMTTFFNLPWFADVLPRIWRVVGPNFHPISYAYALSVISVALLFRGRWLLPLFFFPLLMIIGSKGAMVMLLVAAVALLLLRLSGPRLAAAFVIVSSVSWVSLAIVFGMRSGDYHVLGFFAGIRDFLSNPLGEGLGIGGNLSSDSSRLDWEAAQSAGASAVPVESAVGVMLYQMGIGAMAFFGFLFALAATLLKRFLATSESRYLAGFVMITVVSANAVLQEEAFYSPLALGLILLMVGGTLARAIQPKPI